MKSALSILVCMFFLHWQCALATEANPPELNKNSNTATSHNKAQGPLQCAAFSPYVGNLTPDYGATPPREVIDQLLDKLIKETPFRCIMTYGVMGGLEYTFAAAEARHIKVIAIIWLDKDTAVNSKSIASGIDVAKAFPNTIIKLSCGSEVRTRHGNVFDGEISRCINDLRKAGVKQPITTIDTWWEWCNREKSCKPTSFTKQVDWIGTNIFPWWENQHSDIYPCTPAKQAADFHINRLKDLRRTYPKKDVIVTEFGWPSVAKDDTKSKAHNKQQCGIASKKNQLLVVNQTFKKLAEHKWSGVVFEAFEENWKSSNEGNVGKFWGLCQGTPPYSCPKGLKIK